MDDSEEITIGLVSATVRRKEFTRTRACLPSNNG